MSSEGPRRGDVVLALVLMFVAIVGTSAIGAEGARFASGRAADAFAVAGAATAAVTLVVRRRWPLTTLGVVAAITGTYLVVGYPYGPITLVFAVAVFSAARFRDLRHAAPAAAVALAALAAHVLLGRSPLPGTWGLLPATAWVVVPFAIGTIVRVTREASERGRADLLDRRIADERLQVAREVHDIVGHGLSAIKMQADVALHVLPKQPEQAEVALASISRTSGEALEELRATLGVLRAGHVEAERDPASRLANLEDLRRRMADAGARIDVEVVGTVRPLPAAVDLAGYRIVQESLTNVLRHARTKEATVRVGYREDAVEITVSNPHPEGPTGPGGLGVDGMRERVARLGGDLWAGPTGDRRFEVHAVLPTDGAPA